MQPQPPPKQSRLFEVIRVFARLGFTAFGGPAAHVAMIEDEVVNRRHWLDRRHFMDLVASVNFIPGPNSTELAIHLGLIRAGYPGLIAAGACFILPAVCIILPLAWMYVSYGKLPQVLPVMAGINAVVIAIIANAMVRFARSSIKDAFLLIVAIDSMLIALLLQLKFNIQPEIYVLAIAACAGWVRSRRGLTAGLPMLMGGALIPATAPAGGATITSLALFFLKIGATLFGSGYVLVSYLQSGLVDSHHWLTSRQLLDAISVGQFTPGPLLTTATFVGYLIGHQNFNFGAASGIIGAMAATICIFLPSFVLVALCAPILNRIRQNPSARSALDAMNAAVVSLLAITCVQLAGKSLNDFWWAGIALASLIVLLWRNINATWLILIGGAIGWVRAGIA